MGRKIELTVWGKFLYHAWWLYPVTVWLAGVTPAKWALKENPFHDGDGG